MQSPYNIRLFSFIIIIIISNISIISSGNIISLIKLEYLGAMTPLPVL